MRLKPMLALVGAAVGTGLLAAVTSSAFTGGWVPVIGSTSGGVEVGLLWLFVLAPALVSISSALVMLVVLTRLLTRTPSRGSSLHRPPAGEGPSPTPAAAAASSS
jgi:hypothetical protein